MKVQLRMSPTLKLFEESFKNKYNLTDYNNTEELTIFCGIFRQADRFAIINHKGPGILYLAGSDTIEERRVKWLKKRVSCMDNIIIVVASDWIENDLKKFNVHYVKIALLRTNINLWK